MIASLTTVSAAAQDLAHPPAIVDAGVGPETFVLVSGMVGGVAGFHRLQTLLLGRGARVIIIDPYALSIDSADVSFAAMARRVDRALTKAGVGVVRIVAHSQGAGVALRLAAMSSQRVDCLYFLDSGALAVNRGPTLSAALRVVPIITRVPGGRGFVRSRFLSGIRRNAGRQDWLDDETQRAYTEPLLASIDRVVAMAVRLSTAEEPEPLASVVSRVRSPLTVVISAAPHEADIGPEEITALAPLRGLVRFERLPGVGHFPHEEAPNEVLALITAPSRLAAVAATMETAVR
jgi:pimeloyl-ACP methyl ester carboxylesterase